MQSKGDVILRLLELGFTLNDIKSMTTLEVNMYLQRNQEPLYKNQLDAEIKKNENK